MNENQNKEFELLENYKMKSDIFDIQMIKKNENFKIQKQDNQIYFGEFQNN